jgi:tetratricopeptide (TPR) repeat protein
MIQPTSLLTSVSGVPRKRRPYFLIGMTLLGVALLGGAIGSWLYRVTAIKPPTIVTDGVEPLVAKAIEYARLRVTQEPRSAEAWGFLGKVLRAHEFHADGDLCFAQAAKLDPGDPRWPYLLSRGLLGVNPDGALPYLERAVALGGNVTSPRLVLGELLLEKGRVEESASQFRQVLQIDTEDPRAHLGLGRIAYFRGDLKASLDHLRRSAAQAPKVKATHAVLAQVYHRLGQEIASADELRLMKELSEEWVWPDPYIEEVSRVWIGLKARLASVTDLRNKGRDLEALQHLRALVKDYPDSARAQFVLGQTLNRLGSGMEAEPVLREALRLDPSNSIAHFELGSILQQQGKEDAAAQSYRKATQLQPDLAPAYFNLSFCLNKPEEHESKVQALRDAVRYKPDFAPALRQLGGLLAQDGHYAEAREYLERAVQLAPADERAKLWLEKVKEYVAPPGTP